MSGIRMDHYLEVDFTGFKKLIDELGGVEVTTTKAIDDPDSHLDLDAGTHTLNGEQALGLVRTRHGVGDGSDLGRIQLQQAFIKALIDQVKHIGLFDNPQEAVRPRRHRHQGLTTDSDLGVGELADVLRREPQGHRLDQHEHGHAAGPVRPGRPQPRPARRGEGQAGLDALRRTRPIPAAATEGNARRRGSRAIVTSS